MLLKNNSMKLALCGMLTALATTGMFLTNLIPIASYTLPAIGGALTVIAVLEIGKSWAWSVYIASSLLSVLVVVDKEAVAMFVLFFGYYPIIKANLEQMKKKYLGWLAKLAVFNLSMILEFWLALHLLGVPAESFTLFGLYLPWVFLLVGNIAFFLYDYCISCGIFVYWKRLHPFIRKWLRLK